MFFPVVVSNRNNMFASSDNEWFRVGLGGARPRMTTHNQVFRVLSESKKNCADLKCKLKLSLNINLS